MSNSDPENTASVTIIALCSALDDTFACLDAWCTTPVEHLQHRPDYPQAWNAAEHLEHVTLVNHFLLLTITKGVASALRRARNQPIPSGESDLIRLAPIADPQAFPWEPPGHMIPTGRQPVAEVRELLNGQYGQCLLLLEQIGNGAGVLCSYRMSVYNLGRLDMYQWLYFLAQHGRWHLAFLAQREAGWGS
jgi:DinB superfamily